MKQTKKGNRWRFGMKLHSGVDDQTGLGHSLATIAIEQGLSLFPDRFWPDWTGFDWRSLPIAMQSPV
ncbi:MAG: transposase [Synechococcus sp. SB0675_bin_6]|nr:transposase [Synechococcus sp. SB0675_bin_6]